MGSAALAVAAAVLPREGDPICCWGLMNEILEDTVLDKVLLQCSHADISLRMSYDYFKWIFARKKLYSDDDGFQTRCIKGVLLY